MQGHLSVKGYGHVANNCASRMSMNLLKNLPIGHLICMVFRISQFVELLLYICIVSLQAWALYFAVLL